MPYTPFAMQCEAIENTIGDAVQDEHVPAILDVLERCGCYVSTSYGQPTIDGVVSGDTIIRIICNVLEHLENGESFPELQGLDGECIARASAAYSKRLGMVVCNCDKGGFLLYSPDDWNMENCADYCAEDDGTITLWGHPTGESLTFSEMANAF